MKITSININGYGKFANKTISFTDGLNVVYGNNEAGKSTTHTFIKSMLFGTKKKKSKVLVDTYTKYMPWDKNSKYEGTLTFNHKGKNYQIYRVFDEKNPILEIRDIDGKGKLINNPEVFLHRVLNNLSIDSFDNTISIGQLKSAQDKSMVDELKKFIANLNTSGNMSINTLSAINFLKQRKDSLQMNLNSDATMLYNKQLGNIRNIEKELSNKNYENKLPEILQKKNSESRKIERNNEEIENLKQSIVEKRIILENYGFTSKEDIDSLAVQTNKIFFDFKPIMSNSKLMRSLTTNIIFTAIGILLIVFSFLFLVVTYPDVATILNVNNVKYSLMGITNFIMNLPFHPIILISLFLCIGIILIVGNILLFYSNYQSINKSKEIQNVISDIFNQHINDDEVTSDNMLLFKKHISSMKKMAKSIDDFEARISLLTEENNILLKNQAEYSDTIKSQQRIQYDVEQKYNELYALKDENEKLKQELSNNDQIKKEIDSIDLAIETLTSLSNEIQVMFGTHLNKSVSVYIDALTNHKYNSLNVDNALNITINYEDKVISLDKLSTGTMDQIYLALRLAISDIVCTNREKLPLLFDDCFAMYDNERLESTLKFLSSNIDSQIIIFTCHTRERALLSHNKVPFNSIDIEKT
jgi:DNA repair exonuclease SbcCD ATPase subunit